MSSQSARAQRFLRHLEPLQDALGAYCQRALHDSAAVEDVLQNALADAFRDFHLYAENTNFRAWIFRYLNLEILEHNRRYEKIRAEQPLPDELSTSEDSDAGLQEQLFAALAETPEVVLEHCDAALAAAIRQLGPQERSVLLLRAIGEFKYAEIADILGIPIGTVMSSLARTRERLRAQLADFGRRQNLFGDNA